MGLFSRPFQPTTHAQQNRSISAELNLNLHIKCKIFFRHGPFFKKQKFSLDKKKARKGVDINYKVSLKSPAIC